MKKISYILIFSLCTPPIPTPLAASIGKQLTDKKSLKNHIKDNNGNPQIICTMLAIGLTSIGIFSFCYLRKKPTPSFPEKPSEPPINLSQPQQLRGKTRKQELEDALAQTKTLLRILEKMENDFSQKKD